MARQKRKKAVKKPPVPTLTYAFTRVRPKTPEDTHTIFQCNRLFIRARNKLLEIKLVRCEMYRRMVREQFPEIADQQDIMDEANRQLDAIYGVISKRNQKRRRRKLSKEEEAAVKPMKALLSRANARFKELKAAIKGEFDCDISDACNNFGSSETAPQYRQFRDAGLGWGSWNEAAKHIKGRTNWFRPWDGTGCISVDVGYSVEAALSGRRKQLSLAPVELVPQQVTKRDGRVITLPMQQPGSRRAKYRYQAEIGYDVEGNKSVTVIFDMTRPLPPGAIITQAKLLTVRVGPSVDFKLLLILKSPQGFPREEQRASGGSVGIVYCYKHLPDGSLCVAKWAGSDGATGEIVLSNRESQTLSVLSRTGEEEELNLPGRYWDRLERVDSKQSRRDVAFDEMVAQIRAWKANRELPVWFKEETEYIHAWKAKRKLARLYRHWGDSRIVGDEDIFALLAAWCKQDKHWYSTQEHQRRKTIRQRREVFRVAAADLRRRYAQVFHAMRDVQKEADEVATLPEKKGVPSDAVATMQKIRRRSAIGELQSWITYACQGVDVAKEVAKNVCHVCGADIGKAQKIRCECGVHCDRDENAAHNVLAAGLLHGLQVTQEAV